MVQIAGLRVAHHRSQPADGARAAVDHAIVDYDLIAESPQAAAEEPRAGHDHMLVEPVEAVFIDQYRMQPFETTLRRIREIRPLEEEQPGGEYPQGGQPYRPRVECRPHELQRRAVKLLAHAS